jgi:phosphoribosyl 1,2-cyclic phosphate phosphodiesterase
VKIEFLGTGGATTTPRPSCHCRICDQAREYGVPYSRTGPAIFVHGPDILFDTSEEIKDQLNRSNIDHIAGCFYSHWHPDHTMGRRIWETRNMDFRHWPPKSLRTDVYLPEQVAIDFRERLGLREHFEFMKRHATVQVIELQDGVTVEIGGVEIKPFRVAEDYVYAFLLTSATARILIAPDELNNWVPVDLGPLALAILPMGVVEFDVFSGQPRIDAEHPMLEMEATFEETLEIVRRLNAQRTILTHIEEPDGLSYDDLLRLERKLELEGLNVTFAYDTMIVDVG